MMDVKAEIETMETQLRAEGITVADVLRDAGITASTWGRWKRDGQVPLLSTWERIQAAFRRRTPPKGVLYRRRRRVRR